ncbi:trans-acting enoyl reductase family protein [Lewinella sp. JB7]|uniref:saccharopine dehydrogenase family protein n=1 Tax=Lewinella sp. JB7 TaxID=2962887 RepID=UPI0020C9C286|nr:saccharopine dehydrogenase NADP-binding domain-containing protein [Lewinella sp. JB7]MCP9237575.1 saccharopine dehydrogenase NADP-binding domain-containing protein [Lewinella sp. JB7]
MADFILYGAYGYTGRLITRTAAEYGLRPLLSGRNAQKLEAMSLEFGYDYRAVDLKNRTELHDLLKGYKVVLHAAGPFAETAAPMQKACLATGVHYLDITGEISVFAASARRGPEAERAGVMLMPGVGFDVVPTDCLAAYLKRCMPEATELVLAFAWKGGMISHGTSKTMLGGLGRGGAVRRNGKIVPVPAAHDERSFPFTEEATLNAVTIPWGDVFTAYFTTGIPNIRTYFAVPPAQIKMMKRSNYLGPILRLGIVQKFLAKKIEARPAGPDDEQRQRAEAYVYGEVKDVSGKTVAARLRTPEGYTLTAITALMIVRRVLDGEMEPGYRTPAGVYGPDLIMEVAGVTREDLA